MVFDIFRRHAVPLKLVKVQFGILFLRFIQKPDSLVVTFFKYRIVEFGRFRFNAG